MALTLEGYMRPTYDDILDDKITLAQTLFGDDIDTSELTPLGKFIRIGAKDMEQVYEDIENVYYSRFPNTATGTTLSRLGAYAGITRNSATEAKHTITITGTAGASIIMGFLVRTTDGTEFYTVEDVVIGEEGNVSTDVCCTVGGTVGNVAVGDITEIVNPDVNVTSITHTAIVSLGEAEETDEKFRVRFEEAIKGMGGCTPDAIKASVLRVNDVYSVAVVENETSETVDGRPPHSFETYVHGVDNATHRELIAQAIFDKSPAGIQSHGTVTEVITDLSGANQTVKFTYVSIVQVHINCSIKTNNDYSIYGEDEIKENLANYVNALGAGGDIYLSALYGKIHEVSGIDSVTVLQTSTDGTTFSSADVMFEFSQCPQLSEENITVTVVTE